MMLWRFIRADARRISIVSKAASAFVPYLANRAGADSTCTASHFNTSLAMNLLLEKKVAADLRRMFDTPSIMYI
eukprot:scaffold106983_cov23-Cyclotella_meneghiniana.AAC.1